MKAIRTFCCCCDVLVDVFHVEGDGSIECLGDRCPTCVEIQKNEAKTFKRVQKPKLGVIVNDSKDFDRMMSERKVNNKLNQPNNQLKKKGGKK